ncbi:hypothetical protein [Halomonas ramblicola]|uniref:hypothetical protein n=1 Tax=Halomonas ramblicola TaxID=747349 RepID=UPI0025B38BEA|nr:hypothetical protein [Halomonas ramblicola]MDN3521511.1 hypothetical protein [Halomonas ramblicola]
MAKPRIKLKSARAAAEGQRDLDRALRLLAEAVGMTPSQVMRNPHAAKAKWKLKEAEGQQARRKAASSLAPLAEALGWSTDQVAMTNEEAIEQRIEEMKQQHIEARLAEEHERVIGILHACDVTGQHQLLHKLVVNGTPVSRAAEHIYDVAASESDGLAIFNGHSPEGGHKKAIDYAKIYGRQNGRKGERA